jgi:hypothetical protein
MRYHSEFFSLRTIYCSLMLAVVAVSAQADGVRFDIETPGLGADDFEDPVYPSDGFIFSILDDDTVFGYGARVLPGSQPLQLKYTAWMRKPDGSMLRLGNYNSLHTGPAGEQASYIAASNQAGQAGGSAAYFDNDQPCGTADDCGRSAWFYDGASTELLGISSADHSYNNGRFKWSEVTDISESGDVLGFTRRYNGLGKYGLSLYSGGSAPDPWIYSNGVLHELRLSDAVHSDYSGNNYSVVLKMNDAGYVAGTSDRYNEAGNDELGQTGWVFNGQQSVAVGLSGPGYVRNDGFMYTRVSDFLGPDHVVGYSYYYPQGTHYGFHAWLYDGNAYTLLGLEGPEYTSPSSGTQGHLITGMAANGAVIGTSSRYSAAGTTMLQTRTPWIYAGDFVRALGFFDSEHTDSAGESHNFVEFVNDSGQVAGNSERLTPAGINKGWTTWLWNGTAQVRMGLVDDDHTRTSYKARFSYVHGINEAGQVIGTSERFHNGTGHSAWLFDGTQTIDITLQNPVHTGPNGEFNMYLGEDHGVFTDSGMVAGQAGVFRSTDGLEVSETAWLWDGTQIIDFAGLSIDSSERQDSKVLHIFDDGSVIGEYTDHATWCCGSSQLFYYSAETGIVKLKEHMDEAWGEDGWTRLDEVQAIRGDKFFGGYGRTDFSRQRPFLITTREVQEVAIDVQPADATNEVDLLNANTVDVAILTTSVAAGDSRDFDASLVKIGTLRFGVGKTGIKGSAELTDVDGDADNDMQLEFRINDAGIVCADTSVKLTGETWNDELIMGTDTIDTVNCDTNECHP